MDNKKQMKVPRGTARAIRRAGLKKGWRLVKNAKQMLPPAGQQEFNDEVKS